MEITEVEPIVLESAIGTVSIHGGMTEFDATVRPILVKIHTDEGIIGIGETYLDDPKGDMSRSVGQAIEAHGNHLVGRDPRNVVNLWHELYVHAKRSTSFNSLSAIDEALWDIKGKAVNEPLYELLGGKSRPVHAYATFPHRKGIDELIDDGQWLAEKGFTHMKIVVGEDIETDRSRIRQVKENLPDDFGLAIDANTSFNVAQARAVGQTAGEYDLEWFEEPIAHTNLEGQAELNERLTVPIAGYQSHTTQYPAVDHLRAGALEIYQPALDKVGGVTPATRVANLVEGFGKEFLPHAFGPMVNYAASIHVAASTPACNRIEFAVYDDEIDDPGKYVASPYVDNQEAVYVQDGGRIEPPEGPGLGIHLDEEIVEEYRID